MRTGESINKVPVDVDSARIPYVDIDIIAFAADNFTYAVMSNKKLQVFQRSKEMWSLSAADNETFVFMGYNYKAETVMIAATEGEQGEIQVRSVNGAVETFGFTFSPYTDVLVKTRNHVLAIRMPPYAEETIIVAYRLQQQEMLFNKVAEVVGMEFQVRDW